MQEPAKFKPNLSINAASFVPSVKPVVEFSPIKEANPEKAPPVENGVSKMLFAPSVFNVNAPVFKPTIPLATVAPSAPDPKKKNNKKKKADGEKA
jgi:hypothetical protein